MNQSQFVASVDNTNITDLFFADAAVILAESLELLVLSLEILQQEAKPLKLQVSLTKVQMFGGLLDEAIQQSHACDKDIDILESFTYLGNIVMSKTLKVNWPGPRCYGLTQHEYLALLVPVHTGKDFDLQDTGDLCLTVWM